MIQDTTAEIFEVRRKVTLASKKIAPLWPLSHFVAVNPFVGFADQCFSAVAVSHKRILGSDTVMLRDWFKAKFETGDIGVQNLRAAVMAAVPTVVESFQAAEEELTADRLIELLAVASEDKTYYQTCSFSVYLDAREGTTWQHIIREEAAKWCAAYDDEGQSSWKFPWKEMSLYQGWKAAAQIDRNPELRGLKGFRERVASFADEPEQAIKQAVAILQMPETHVEELFYRILLTLPGWAGHLRYKDRELELRGGEGDSVAQLLAILLNYEVALYQQYQDDSDRVLGWIQNLEEDTVCQAETVVPFELAQRLVWQLALENAFEQKLRADIRPQLSAEADVERPDVQAVFCIDVRSEVLRRALESVSLNVQTIGFAGFFGIPIDHEVPGLGPRQARCPVLLAPPIKTAENGNCLADTEFDKLTFERVNTRESERGWKRFKEAAASCFTFVETFGLSYAYKIMRDAFARFDPKSGVVGPGKPGFLDLSDVRQRADVAAGILKGISLTDNFAKLVLFCGHGSSTKNNPYASGLDCGACGGHKGDANARLAAGLLNESDVRVELAARGIEIPENTTFIAGLHNTTTDVVDLFDLESVDVRLVAELREALDQAGALTAMERSVHLDAAAGASDVLGAVRGRSADWSQVRPEWGLAGNAGFIVAPRTWTAGASLKGRSFLHEYDAAADSEGALLEQILGGPLVVGSWINLQYYGSAADNAHFGSGHKSIHNVVGGVGVALGNENDLRPGLPLQSVHDGAKLYHEPLRLHACIAAEPEVLDGILSRQKHLNDLVVNGWIHFFALGANGQLWQKRRADGSWSVLGQQQCVA
jgi:uncharacterized protein